MDVFDEGEMPAVTYAQPDGLTWEQVEALLKPLVSSPALAGLSIADFKAATRAVSPNSSPTSSSSRSELPRTSTY